jgi:hypothetical protein
VQLLYEQWQRRLRSGLRDEFEKPTSQAVIVVLSGKLRDQLIDMLGSVRQEKVEAVLPGLRVATSHQPHRLLETRCHAPKVPVRTRIIARLLGRMARGFTGAGSSAGQMPVVPSDHNRR